MPILHLPRRGVRSALSARAPRGHGAPVPACVGPDRPLTLAGPACRCRPLSPGRPGDGRPSALWRGSSGRFRAAGRRSVAWHRFGRVPEPGPLGSVPTAPVSGRGV